MIQGHDRKLKRKSLHCCYCCIEVLSRVLLLVLVASAITLLRYFLEFSNLPFKVAKNEPQLATDQTPSQVPVRSTTQSPTETSFMHKIVSHQSTTPLKPNSLLTPSLLEDSPHHLSEMSSSRTHPVLPTRPTSPRTLRYSQEPPTSSVSHSLTLAPEKTPFGWPTPMTKVASPQDLLSSAEGPTSPSEIATTLTSSYNQTTAMGWTHQRGFGYKTGLLPKPDGATIASEPHHRDQHNFST